MFKINRKIEYALIALRHMSAKTSGQLTSAKEICDVYQTPFDPTSRVMQVMTSHRILHAEQGARGGYKIALDLNKISMRELSDMIIGPIEIASCFHGDYSNCEVTHCCNIISPMLNLNEQINKVFSNISVAELISSKHSNEKIIRQKEIIESTAKRG